MKLKKLAAVLFAAVLTAAMLLIPASAESIADTAKARYNGDSFSIKLNNTDKDVYHDYKVKLTKGGDLKIDLSAAVERTDITLFDSSGNEVSPSVSASKTTTGGFGSSIFGGTYPERCYWNETVEKFKGQVVYKDLDKGTYYIRIYKGKSYQYSGQGKCSVKFTFPGETAEEKESTETKASPSLAVTLKAGETLSLGVADADGTVSWSSSDKTVAAVDKNGKVTAKKAGNATVTAKSGKTSLTLQITVK